MQPMSRPKAPAPAIAALPSLAHSLSSFPTMTTVSQDMVHYGTMGRTKKIGEAKLNSALQRTKQRQNAIPSPPIMPSPATHTQLLPADDEPVLSIRRRQKPRPTA
ncbi:hypothetical protein OBBRIDRAFT_838805 [Obba rivulosa]|uniref:Uncharacterized protein n=1 Tax=Obba rivulosa TaxID=1052685 RepID=A0A8E2ANU5_9APHY|nr:hypothetical protein OBBRIDRAFT_838805 [Obba rivulosa]